MIDVDTQRELDDAKHIDNDSSFCLDEYDLEECEYREEDESMRLPIKEYDRLLRIEKQYHKLNKAYVELSKSMKGTINYEQE